MSKRIPDSRATLHCISLLLLPVLLRHVVSRLAYLRQLLAQEEPIVKRVAARPRQPHLMVAALSSAAVWNSIERYGQMALSRPMQYAVFSSSPVRSSGADNGSQPEGDAGDGAQVLVAGPDLMPAPAAVVGACDVGLKKPARSPLRG